ncbi:MAG: tetratricopeptide repeat protein [Synechococcales cyanobacterium T60_A2020_003]|nr:tetratricopeptide repeat protein [Synechococcales cyanobacterium T60_A2020_003]
MEPSPAILADNLLTQGHYADAVAVYAQALDREPENVELYWNYGIALLLNDQEEEAQSVWMTILMEAELESEQAYLTTQLAESLEAEAQRCEARRDARSAWIVRRYQCEFVPENPVSLRDLILVGLQAHTLSLDDAEIDYFNAIAPASETLFSPSNVGKTAQLLYRLLEQDPAHPATQTFIATCIQFTQTTPQANAIASALQKAARHHQKQFRHDWAIALIRHAIQVSPENLELLEEATDILILDLESRREAIELAERGLSLAKRPVDRLRAMEALILRLLHSGGQLQKVQTIFQDYERLLQELAIAVEPISTLDPLTDSEQLSLYVEQLGDLYKLTAGGFPYFYFNDNPPTFRPIRNRLATAAQVHTQSLLPSSVKKYHASHQSTGRRTLDRPIRVGYIAETLRQHSVGWLSRWLLHYHDRDRVEVHLYTSTTKRDDFVQDALRRDYSDRFHTVSATGQAIAEQIFNDEIDILVDLDGMTEPTFLTAMSLKPAPVQISWLGFDGSGIPAVDYFIADSYVLPDSADQYYQEKIWRLPKTYIAVDGFEIFTPTLRRQDLGIPDRAIVYLSSQTGLKRNPHNVKVQLQILKAVPSSYFLIKSTGSDPDLLQSFFFDLAEEIGVGSDRLRFLPDFPLEFEHRANLQLADVVLDTYPYNGATTTLEALWMGLPIVTRVGEQFAARNSYTMMMNAGITEGIAWSDEEYVEWGIRMGQDENLRRDVYWKLRKSRHTAPLWNAKQFAREMEAAYEQMWQIWCG